MDWNVENKRFVREYQRLRGLDADGLAGPGTFADLGELLGAKGAPGPQGVDTPDGGVVHKVGVYKQYTYGDDKHIGGDPDMDLLRKSGCLTCNFASIITLHTPIEPMACSEAFYQFDVYNKANSQIKSYEAVKDACKAMTGMEWFYDRHDGNEYYNDMKDAVVAHPVIIQVSCEALPMHFVVGKGVNADGEVLIMDPGTGDHHDGADLLFGYRGYEFIGYREFYPLV